VKSYVTEVKSKFALISLRPWYHRWCW